MLELSSDRFESVLPLLADFPQRVLPQAICQGINPGRVFVDRLEEPRTAFIWSPVGYYFLAGQPGAAVDMAALRHVLIDTFVPASRAGGETGLILIPSSPEWKAYLPVLLPNREVIEIYRRPFDLDTARFAALADGLGEIPPGLSLQPVDARTAGEAGVLASWASLDDFFEHGVGYALLADDETASVCLSVYASRQRVEIDVHTAEAQRRKGYALWCAAALVKECQRRGLQPNWECFWDNEPSARLAARLGFRALPDYPVFYWDEEDPG